MFVPVVGSDGRLCVDATGRVSNCCDQVDPPDPTGLRLRNCVIVDCGVADVLVPEGAIILRLPPDPRCQNADGTPGRLLQPGDIVIWAGVCWQVSANQTLDGPLLQRTLFECRQRCDEPICTATKYLPVEPCPINETLSPPPPRIAYICAAKALAKFSAGECPMALVPSDLAYNGNPPPNAPGFLCYQAVLTDALLDDDLPANALILDDLSSDSSCCECAGRQYDRCQWQDFTGQANWIQGDSVCCLDCTTWSATSEWLRRVELFANCPFATGDFRYSVNEDRATASISNAGTVTRTWSRRAFEERCNGTTNVFFEDNGSDSFSVPPCRSDPFDYLVAPLSQANISFDGSRVTERIRKTCSQYSSEVLGQYTEDVGGRTVTTVVSIFLRVRVQSQQGLCGPSSCLTGDGLVFPPSAVPPDADPIDILTAAGVL